MKTKMFGAILIAILLVGMVVVPNTMAKKDKDNTTPVEKQKNIDSTTPWDTQKALLVEEKLDKVLKQGLVSTSSFTTDHVTYIRTDTLDASDPSVATASATYKLYKEDVTDSNYDYYIVWKKATGYNIPDVDPIWGDSNLHEVRPGVTLNRANDRIIDWEPYTDDSSGMPKTVTASLSVSHGGVTAGISETYNVQQDHIGPQSSNTGQYGYFKAHWNGNYEGAQGVIGGTEIRVPKGTDYSYVINLFVEGDVY